MTVKSSSTLFNKNESGMKMLKDEMEKNAMLKLFCQRIAVVRDSYNS